MFETTGSLAVVQPVLALVALVALPLLWAVVAGFVARAGGRRPGDEEGAATSPDLVATIVAITCAVGTLGLAVVMAARLSLLPRGCVLVQHVAQLARLGQLDLAFDLTLDPRSATFVLVVAVVACASALDTAWSTRPRATARLAWSGVATAGAMLLCAGDGFAPILVGLGALSLGVWGLSSPAASQPSATAMLAGSVSIVVGLVFLFWSLGGAFGSEGYDPDGAPRFVLVTTPSRVESAKATLTMTTHAGALVSSDDADLPGEPIRAPFSVVVDPGVHTLRVQGGAATADVVVPRVVFVAGRSHVLTPYGPTASLRALDDQLAVPRLAPGGGEAGVRAALTRTVGGVRASVVVLLLVLGGAIAFVHVLASQRGPSALALGLAAVPAPYLALRLAPLVEPGGGPGGALVAVLGGASALLLAANAACVDDGHKALRGTLAATASLAVVAVAVGEPASVSIIASSALISTSAAIAAIDARRDVRWLGVAVAGGTGLFPGAGASAGYVFATATALGSATAPDARPGWAVFAVLVAAAMALSAALASLAAFRVYDAVLRASVRDPGMSAGHGALVVVLALLALAFGTVLGAGTTSFGGAVVPLARRLVSAPDATTSRLVGAIALVATLVATGGGAYLARRVSLSDAAPRWLLALGRPYAALGSAVSAASAAAGFLERGAEALDRDFIDDVPAALRDLALRFTGRAPGPPRVASSSPSADAPGASDRTRMLVLFALATLLTFVVLSSFVLS